LELQSGSEVALKESGRRGVRSGDTKWMEPYEKKSRIVVAIILIIATIAIPRLLRSRQVANESAALATLRNVNTAQVSYESTNHVYGTVSDLVTAGLIDNRYSSTLSGYDIVVTLSADTLDYTAIATARSQNDGRYDYYTAPDFVIRYSTIASRAPSGLAGEPVR
jgi:type II secretory pathway pseudopilin PulG